MKWLTEHPPFLQIQKKTLGLVGGCLMQKSFLLCTFLRQQTKRTPWHSLGNLQEDQSLDQVAFEY